MTLKELSQYWYLKFEIEEEEKVLASLRERMPGTTGHAPDGMPKGNCYDNKIEKYAADIVDLENKINSQKERCKRIERYIDGIYDSLTRQIFKLRFLKGYSWGEVAKSIKGHNTADTVRKNCYRYIEKSKK